MFSRWPVDEFSQAWKTELAVGYPKAMFSPELAEYPHADTRSPKLRAMGGEGSAWVMYPSQAMWRDFHSADALRVGEILRANSPLLARCWFVSASTSAAISGRDVPQSPPGLQSPTRSAYDENSGCATAEPAAGAPGAQMAVSTTMQANARIEGGLT